ncbi:hypothetical protein MRB53_027622 [Persea americana]|uniref:Uncharacterized protein n=1 Tax=Persea americana TaxID=3435 RepID=A0ACC2LLD6_PERAE|nr:hypothetical protein MRB53_027622 [Persea americana]
MASTELRKKPNPGRGGVLSHSLSDEEAGARVITEIVNSLVELSRSGETVDLNALKPAVCRKYGLSRAPKLDEMIAALPDSDHNSLLPRLCANPVRTTSSIAINPGPSRRWGGREKEKGERKPGEREREGMEGRRGICPGRPEPVVTADAGQRRRWREVFGVHPVSAPPASTHRSWPPLQDLARLSLLHHSSALDFLHQRRHVQFAASLKDCPAPNITHLAVYSPPASTIRFQIGIFSP